MLQAPCLMERFCQACRKYHGKYKAEKKKHAKRQVEEPKPGKPGKLQRNRLDHQQQKIPDEENMNFRYHI